MPIHDVCAFFDRKNTTEFCFCFIVIIIIFLHVISPYFSLLIHSSFSSQKLHSISYTEKLKPGPQGFYQMRPKEDHWQRNRASQGTPFVLRFLTPSPRADEASRGLEAEVLQRPPTPSLQPPPVPISLPLSLFSCSQLSLVTFFSVSSLFVPNSFLL